MMCVSVDLRRSRMGQGQPLELPAAKRRGDRVAVSVDIEFPDRHVTRVDEISEHPERRVAQRHDALRACGIEFCQQPPSMIGLRESHDVGFGGMRLVAPGGNAEQLYQMRDSPRVKALCGRHTLIVGVQAVRDPGVIAPKAECVKHALLNPVTGGTVQLAAGFHPAQSS